MNAQSIDLDTIDDIPTGTAGPAIGQYAPSAAPQKLAYIKRKKAGSMEELELEDDDGPIVNITGQTGIEPATNTTNYYPAPVHQVPTAQKKEYIKKKKAGSMEELDIDMDDELVVKPPGQTVIAMNEANNCQEPTSLINTSIITEPVLLNSPTAPFIETSCGDLAPIPPISPRSKLPRYNTEHWSGAGHTQVQDHLANNSAPIIDCSIDQPMSISQSCNNPDKPQLLDDGSFEL